MNFQWIFRSFNEFLSRLGFACLQHCLFWWNCSPCIYCEYLLWSVADCLNHFFSFFLVNFTSFLHVWTATHFLQIFIGTTDLILCSCHTYFLLLLLKLQPSLFLHTPRLRGQSHIFPSVEPKLSHFSLCECHTNILYRFSITPEWTMQFVLILYRLPHVSFPHFLHVSTSTHFL